MNYVFTNIILKQLPGEREYAQLTWTIPMETNWRDFDIADPLGTHQDKG